MLLFAAEYDSKCRVLYKLCRHCLHTEVCASLNYLNVVSVGAGGVHSGSILLLC